MLKMDKLALTLIGMPPKQFGFRKNHSTSHAINYSVDHILKFLGGFMSGTACVPKSTVMLGLLLCFESGQIMVYKLQGVFAGGVLCLLL